MDNIGFTIDYLLYLYNSVSEKKLDIEKFRIISSKIQLIIKYFSFEKIEMIGLIDVLVFFQEKNQLERINRETLSFIKKLTDSSLYSPIIIKHILLPSYINKCENEEQELYHISTFETVLEMMNKFCKMEDYNVLNKYNDRLCELLLHYKKAMDLYTKNIQKEVKLSTILSHIFSIFYFNEDEYHNDYIKLTTLYENSINNYQDIVDYCSYEGISNNFTSVFLTEEELQKEYIACKKMIDYIFNNKEKGMKKE